MTNHRLCPANGTGISSSHSPQLALTLTEDESVRDTLQSILTLALRSIPGCHAASVTVLDDKGQPSTVAATDEETYELDRRQYLLHDGPCMDACPAPAGQPVEPRRSGTAMAGIHSRLAEEMGLRSYLAAGLSAWPGGGWEP